MNTFGGLNKEQWLEKAKEYRERCQEGLNEEAIENFRSRWVWGELADLYRQFADYAETGQRFEVVLFDLDGKFIEGKWITNEYGSSYLTNDGLWLNPSRAQKKEVKIRNNAKKGFYEGKAMFKVHYNKSENKAYTKTSMATELIKVIDNGK